MHCPNDMAFNGIFSPHRMTAVVPKPVDHSCISGFLMGRLCVSDQPHSHACARPDGDRKVLSPHLRGLLHCKNIPLVLGS